MRARTAKKKTLDSARREKSSQLIEHGDTLVGRPLSVTTPVYSVDEHQLPAFFGSAVCLEIGHVRFAISAFHVFHHRHQSNLYLHAKNGLVVLRGDFTRLYREDVPEKDDRIDISIARLARDTAEEMSAESFLSWNELDRSFPRVSRDVFFALGFPVNKQRHALNGDELRAAAYPISGLECWPSAYQTLSYDPRSSLLIGFDKKQVWDAQGKVTAPDLNGMSGGGVWRVGPRLTAGSPPPLLSAIGVQWYQKTTPKHVLATRIQPILTAIADQYPDVSRTMRLLP